MAAPCPFARRVRSITWAITPTLANEPSCRGTRKIWLSSPTSMGNLTVIPGKTTESSSGTSRNVSMLAK